jgi:hypothetical protein
MKIISVRFNTNVALAGERFIGAHLQNGQQVSDTLIATLSFSSDERFLKVAYSDKYRPGDSFSELVPMTNVLSIAIAEKPSSKK